MMKRSGGLSRWIKDFLAHITAFAARPVDMGRRNFIARAGKGALALAAGLYLSPQTTGAFSQAAPGSFNILSLDGGGIRVALVARLLERLDLLRPGFLERVDLIGGSSASGILALMLAAGFSPAEARSFFERHAPEIYERAGPQGLLEYLFNPGSIEQRRRTSGALYSSSRLAALLAELFGGRSLGDLQKKVMITSFDLDNEAAVRTERTWKAKVFHNFPSPGFNAGEKVVDVALRASATPGYFPDYQGYIDGGVFAGNPGIVALAGALQLAPGLRNLADLALLSIGSGTNPQFIRDAADWSPEQWNERLVELVMAASVGVTDFQCRQILGGEHYFRIDPVMPFDVPFDAVEKIPALVEVAGRVDLTLALDWMEKSFGGKSSI